MKVVGCGRAPHPTLATLATKLAPQWAPPYPAREGEGLWQG